MFWAASRFQGSVEHVILSVPANDLGSSTLHVDPSEYLRMTTRCVVTLYHKVIGTSNCKSSISRQLRTTDELVNGVLVFLDHAAGTDNRSNQDRSRFHHPAFEN